jgi:mono/diheme cytochrome c family protein
MRKYLKSVVVLSCGVLIVFGLVSRTFAFLSPAQTRKAQAVTTRDIFIRNCARCHGVDGKGDTDLGRKFDIPDLVAETKRMDTARIKRMIANGKQDMPAFGKKLTKKQVAALASYVKKL